MDVSVHRCFYTCVTKQLLQHLGLYTAFNRSCGVGVAQRVHTKALDSCFVAYLVKVGIIGTVFRRFPGTPVDKDKITHDQPGDCPPFAGRYIPVFVRAAEIPFAKGAYP